MRWTHKTPEWDGPKNKDETRIVTRFLWWPHRLGNTTAWLERARIQQKASNHWYATWWGVDDIYVWKDGKSYPSVK